VPQTPYRPDRFSLYPSAATSFSYQFAIILVTRETQAVIASEQWDRLPACLFGMTGKMPVPPAISEAGDCFGLGALAMTTVSMPINPFQGYPAL
jgi:hypothetical protein